MNKTQSRKLNLGCGSDVMPGWVNLDRTRLKGVDVVHDLETGELPFADDSFDVILCKDVLEHLDYLPLMKECHRVLNEMGRMIIEVPHFSSNNCYVDPTHKKAFSIKTFNFFASDTYEGTYRDYYFDFKFKSVERCHLQFDRRPLFFWNYVISPIVNMNRKFMKLYEVTGLVYAFPAVNVCVTLIK